MEIVKIRGSAEAFREHEEVALSESPLGFVAWAWDDAEEGRGDHLAEHLLADREYLASEEGVCLRWAGGGGVKTHAAIRPK